jgi:hypothetical protein
MLRSLRPVTTSSPLRAVTALAAASFALASLHVVSAGWRADLARVPPSYLAVVAVAWGSSFLALLALTIVPRRGAMLPDPSRVFFVNVVGPIALVALGATWGRGPAPPMASWGGQLQQGAVCLFTGLEVAAVPFIGAALALRRTLPIETRALGAALGAAGGALGALALHFRCGVGGALHVGLAHGGTALVGALIGGAVLPRVVSSRVDREK